MALIKALQAARSSRSSERQRMLACVSFFDLIYEKINILRTLGLPKSQVPSHEGGNELSIIFLETGHCILTKQK